MVITGRHLLSVLFALLLVANVSAQRVSVAFYNVQNLFDTIPSPFKGDQQFTPNGRYKWDSEKYNQKLDALVGVIDSMGADVVGLSEVENERVVRDLVSRLKTDYCYIHRTTSDRRGIDQALLYKGDIFTPEQIWQRGRMGRESLFVRGELWGEELVLVVCHLPSNFNRGVFKKQALCDLVEECCKLVTKGEGVVLMGDFNFDMSSRAIKKQLSRSIGHLNIIKFFSNPIGDDKMVGGSYSFDEQWFLYDNIFVSQNLIGSHFNIRNAGVYLKPFMIPDRSIVQQDEISASDHLPVFIVLELIE